MKLKITKNETAESIKDDKIKRSWELTGNGLQYKLAQLQTKREKINAKLLRKPHMVNDMLYAVAEKID